MEAIANPVIAPAVKKEGNKKHVALEQPKFWGGNNTTEQPIYNTEQSYS